MWFKTVWQHISPDVIVKGFKKCCVSNAKDGPDGGMLWNGIKKDGKVRSQCEEDEGTECEDKECDIGWQRQTEFDMHYVLCAVNSGTFF